MHSDLIQRAINSPESIGEEERSELEEVLAGYPWFSVGQILLAKAYHNSGNLRYDDQLHLAAVHAGSRSVIYDLIVSHEVAELNADPETNTSEQGAPMEPSMHEFAEERLPDESEKTSIQLPVIPVDDPSPAEPGFESEPETEVAAEVPVPEDSQRESDESDQVDSSGEGMDELDRTIITGAVSRVIEQEVGEEVGTEISPAVPATEKPAVEELSGFAAWVLKRSRETGYLPPGEPEPGTPIEPADLPEDVSAAAAPIQQKQRNLIDNFIASDPKITPGKAGEYNTADLAKESLREDDTFVTETMAKVYARQGKLSKARKAYELLALKYPEKSVYFANQLKKLEKKK